MNFEIFGFIFTGINIIAFYVAGKASTANKFVSETKNEIIKAYKNAFHELIDYTTTSDNDLQTIHDTGIEYEKNIVDNIQKINFAITYDLKKINSLFYRSTLINNFSISLFVFSIISLLIGFSGKWVSVFQKWDFVFYLVVPLLILLIEGVFFLLVGNIEKKSNCIKEKYYYKNY